MCVVWSCRYLHEVLSIETADTCQLCQLSGSDAQIMQRLITGVGKDHTEFHQLRTCEQNLYTDADAFATHLREDHHVPSSTDTALDLTPWQRVQFLEDFGLIRTSRSLTSRNCCTSAEPQYMFAYVSSGGQL